MGEDLGTSKLRTLFRLYFSLLKSHDYPLYCKPSSLALTEKGTNRSGWQLQGEGMLTEFLREPGVLSRYAEEGPGVESTRKDGLLNGD